MAVFKHPATITLSGPTGSGKTSFCLRIIENIDLMFNPPPVKVLFCYSENQSLYENLPKGVELVKGLPDSDYLQSTKTISKLVILDDMMTAVDKSVCDMFIKGSHHWNMSIMLIKQNIFHGKRECRINSSYLVLFRSPNDKLQISTLGRQLFPESKGYIADAYKKACSTPYSYLLIDCHQETEEELRLKSSIFPGEFTSVYLPTDKCLPQKDLSIIGTNYAL